MTGHKSVNASITLTASPQRTARDWGLQYIYVISLVNATLSGLSLWLALLEVPLCEEQVTRLTGANGTV